MVIVVFTVVATGFAPGRGFFGRPDRGPTRSPARHPPACLMANKVGIQAIRKGFDAAFGPQNKMPYRDSSEKTDDPGPNAKEVAMFMNQNQKAADVFLSRIRKPLSEGEHHLVKHALGDVSQKLIETETRSKQTEVTARPSNPCFEPGTPRRCPRRGPCAPSPADAVFAPHSVSS